MKKKIIIAIVIVAAIFAGLVAVKALQIGKMISAGKSFTMPPETISSAVAQEQSWQDTLTAVGSISAAQGVTVAAEIEIGRLLRGAGGLACATGILAREV